MSTPPRKSPEELIRIASLHARWLAKRSGGIRADLSLQNLSGAKLSGINLQSAKLTGCKLIGASMARGNFDHCDL